MDNFELQKLCDLPIEGVAERLGLRVSRHKCLCPFHDDHTPSLTFKNNKFRCWSCGESGDSISLAQKVLGKDFREACRWLADEHNIIIDEWKPVRTDEEQKPFDASRYERFFERPWLSEEARRFLFVERRIDPRVVRWCRLTSWRDRKGTDWLQIPYYDQEGKLVGVQNRNLMVSRFKVQDSSRLPRFRFPKGSQCGIYNQPVLNLLKPGEPLYITEGASDCWAMLSSGHKAIAIPSATLLGARERELLSTLNSKLSTSFHMYPDQDLPGEQLFLQLREVLPTLVHHQLPAGCKDYGEYWSPLTPEGGGLTRCEGVSLPP